MKYCPGCGAKIVGAPKYCEDCGAALGAPPPRVETAVSSPPPTVDGTPTKRPRLFAVALIAAMVLVGVVTVFVIAQGGLFGGRARGRLPEVAQFIGGTPSALESALRPSRQSTDYTGHPQFNLDDVATLDGKTVEVSYYTNGSVIETVTIGGLERPISSDIRAILSGVGEFKTVDIVYYSPDSAGGLWIAGGFAQTLGGNWVTFHYLGSLSPDKTMGFNFSRPETDLSDPAQRAKMVGAERARMAAEFPDQGGTPQTFVLDAPNPELDGLSAAPASISSASSPNAGTLPVPDFITLRDTLWSEAEVDDGGHVVGRSPDDILLDKIREAGFTPDLVLDPDPDLLDSYQTPEAGAYASRGSTVKVVIAWGRGD
jgi:hypothetical protein